MLNCFIGVFRNVNRSESKRLTVGVFRNVNQSEPKCLTDGIFRNVNQSESKCLIVSLAYLGMLTKANRNA